MRSDARPLVRQEPCLVCGRYGVDSAHHPVRRSHGAGYGLLEMIPLCRLHHRLLDDGVGPWPEIIGELAGSYHSRQGKLYTDVAIYMGPEDRIREARRER